MYANEAAAASMGFASVADLLSTPPAEIASLYDSYLEDGSPLTLADLPGRRVLEGETPEPLLVRAINRETGEERFNLVKASAVRDRQGVPRLAVNVIEDVTEAQRAEFAQRLLVHAGEVLASSLDYERTLQQVAELAVPELGDWCGVSLPDRHGAIRQVAVAHRDPHKIRWARDLARRYPTHIDDPSGSAEVLRTGVPEVVNDITDEMLRASARDDEHYEVIQQLGMRAALLVPLTVGGRAIGVMVIVSAESRRTFTDADVRLAAELARRAGTAVDNARLYTERSTIAATLQAGLRPQALPEMPGFSTAALYRPAGAANSVGGDFYDAFEVPAGWMVVVGDVAGRGAPAAATTAVARHTLRTAAQLLESPLDALERLNNELLARGGDALCTVVCACLSDSEATIVCAGHPPAVHIRAGEPERVGRFGPMLGAIGGATWESVTVSLDVGDTLVLYTDGVIDTVGRDGRFGEDRLGAALAGTEAPGDAVARIEAAVLEFEHGEQADDTAVVAVSRITPA
jgi:serine phosphatase RsbU (regulator of sigma subunit)